MSTELFNKIVEEYGGWDAALADAEEQMLVAEMRATKLRATAAVIRRMIADGEPWPTQNSDNTAHLV